MRRVILALVLTLSFQALSSQDMDTLFLWPGDVPGEDAPKHPAVETDNKEGNTIRLTDVTDPILVAVKPDPDRANGSAVIVCPGGGYNILSIDKEGYEIAEWLAGLGYEAYVLYYRVPQKQEGALQDVQRAIRIIRRRMDGQGTVGVLGFSAGGSLAARAATRFGVNTYDAVDVADQLSCRPDFSVLIYPAYLDKGPDRSLTPELTITDDTPPVFIFGTADDKHGNSALVMAGALRDAGIPIDIHMLSKGGHGYGMRKGNIAGETWPVLCETWLGSIR